MTMVLPQLPAEPLHQHEHLLGRDPVEVARGLVGHDQGGVGRERARDGHPLLLPARELPRGVVHAVLEPDQPQDRARVLAALAPRQVRQHERQLHVFEGGQHRDEVVELEDEPDVRGAPGGELAFRTAR